ncbi:MAG TPA: glycoside hydrolase family 15, partial [Terracidiphilus sp.]|nr:glycoside hydrolase family 15 [Terracidiphilus sp.]
MLRLRSLLLILSVILAACAPAFASHLVTGNGFGFGVVVPQTGAITRFYAHPYSFLAPDPHDPLSEGIPTANFLKSLAWGDAPSANASAQYVNDSQVIRIRRADGTGLCFMPFGLSRAALIVSWQPSSPSHGAFHAEWNAPLESRTTLRLAGATVQLLHFTGLPESLLLIPIGPHAPLPESPSNPFAGSRAWALVSLEAGDNPEAVTTEFLQWQAGLAPQALAQREITQLEEWRVKPSVHFASPQERHLWRQSEVMLRIAQCREPNRPGRYSNGLIVASLPDGVWFTPWVRDMAWATVALARMGHQQEARAALLAYFNARPTGLMRAETSNADY